jgi:hypothetical protein
MRRGIITGLAALGLSVIAAEAEADPKLHAYRFADGVTVSDPGHYRLNLSGYVQPWMEGIVYVPKMSPDPDLGEQQTPDGFNQRFRLRRLRLRLVGDAPRQRLSFRFQIDLSGSAEVGDERDGFLLDAFVTYRPTKTMQITFGQRTTYTDNRELFMRSYTLQLVERSRVTSAFASIREFGLFVQDRIRIRQSQHYLRPYFVVTNGDGANAFLKDRGSFKVGGRLDYLPFGLFYNKGQFRQADLVRELTPRLVVGVAYSYNFGISSRRGRRSGDIVYLNEDREDALPGYGKLCADFLFKYRGFSMLGEFVYSHADVPVDDIVYYVRNDGSLSTSVDEDTIKGRMMIGRGYNIQAGYIFPFNTSIDARYTHLDPWQPSAAELAEDPNAEEPSFLNNGTFYNRPNYYTVGLTQYFDNNYGFKIQASVTYVDTAPGTNDLNGDPKDGDEVIVRVGSTLAF